MSRAQNPDRTASSAAASAANGSLSDASAATDSDQTDTTTDVAPVVPTLGLTTRPAEESDTEQLELPVWTTAPLIPFVTDPLPSRRLSRNGAEIARHMVPYWRIRDAERELDAMVRLWVEAN